MKKLVSLLVAVCTLASILGSVNASAFSDTNIVSAYSEQIKNASYNDEDFESVYSLYDLDKDGMPELIIDDNKPHTVRNVDIYKYDNGLVFMGSFAPGYAALCKNPNGKGIITYHAYRNHQWLELVTYNYGGFDCEQITESKEVWGAEDYQEPHEIISGAYRLETCSTGSEELLKKVFAEEIGQRVADYYNSNTNVNGNFVVFSSETIEDDDMLTIIVRYQGEETNIANEIHTLVNVKFYEGEMYVNYIYIGNVWDVENVATSREISVTLNGTKINFDQPPVMKNDRVLVPIRAIFEAMGYSVNWNQSTQTATAVKGSNKITVQLNNSLINYSVNGYSGTYVCDVPPQLVSDRILVPVRAIAESAGSNVEWDDASSTVIINYQDNSYSKQLTYYDGFEHMISFDSFCGIEPYHVEKNHSGNTYIKVYDVSEVPYVVIENYIEALREEGYFIEEPTEENYGQERKLRFHGENIYDKSYNEFGISYYCYAKKLYITITIDNGKPVG